MSMFDYNFEQGCLKERKTILKLFSEAKELN